MFDIIGHGQAYASDCVVNVCIDPSNLVTICLGREVLSFLPLFPKMYVFVCILEDETQLRFCDSIVLP